MPLLAWEISAARPGGFNFRAACDTHDYGYGLIGNTYKGYKYHLDRSKKSNTDNAFCTTMKTHSCKAYNILVRWKMERASARTTTSACSGPWRVVGAFPCIYACAPAGWAGARKRYGVLSAGLSTSRWPARSPRP
ncbi:hypothetical protein [Streptomyces rubradiris]|uniref:hypothetical protein n=1 Tax=Streptomyces rubradiris TaxID=285531 RepID=UPI00167BB2BA|nr:hypothetical protein [Streptomyces rubradiris]